MIVVVMGVSGSGKTTIGKLLAARLGCKFLDGDDFQPPANVGKMAAGTPLTDEDRLPWLMNLNRKLLGDRNAVLACSALSQFAALEPPRDAIEVDVGASVIDCLQIIMARLAED